jgi:flavin-dependent dehydrogenase
MNLISETLSSDEAMSRVWDIVVVGAGCAGAMAARETARRGASTLLVDKASFPRWKVCGCCVNRRAQAALESVGLGKVLKQEGAIPIHGFHVAAAGRSARIPMPRYVALSRERLDAALVRAAIASGAAFLPKAHAMFSPSNGTTRTVVLRTGESTVGVHTRLVLAADGLGGKLLKTAEAFSSDPAKNSRIGASVVCESASDFYESGIIYMACGTGGYVGLTRVENSRPAVAAAFDPAFVRSSGGLGAAAAAVLAEAGLPAIPGIDGLPWRGTPALTRKPSMLAAHRAFVLGDAAGYIEPFTGEGMAWALTSGVAIADLAVEAAREFSSNHIAEWTALHRRVVRRRQFICRSLAAALRRPTWIRRGIAVLSHAPALARPVIRLINTPARAQQGAALP